MTDNEIVLRYLTQQCSGEANATTRSIIVKQLFQLYNVEIEERDLRDIIGHLKEQGHPIGSGNTGIFLCESPEEKDRAGMRQISMGQRNLEQGRLLLAMAKKQREENQYAGVTTL